MSTTHLRRRVAAAGSSEEMPQKHPARTKAITASSEGDPQTHRAKEKVLPSRPRWNSPGTQEAGKITKVRAAGEHKQSKADASRSVPFSSLTNIVDINAKTGSSLGSHRGAAPAQVLEGSSVQHRSKERACTGSSGKMAHHRCAKDQPGTAVKSGAPQNNFSRVKADTGSSGGMLHKHRANMGLNGGMLRKHSGTQLRRNSLGIQGANTLTAPKAAGKKKRAEGNTSPPRDDSQHTSQQLKATTSPDVSTTVNDGEEESAANDTGRYTEEELQELDILIQNLDKLGLGEETSDENFLKYCELLPAPPEICMSVELTGPKLKALNVRLALHRFKYYKLSQVSKNIKGFSEDGSRADDDYLQDDEDDKELSCLQEEDLSRAFLEGEGFFQRFERDGKLDWYFHPDHFRLAALDDYQRIVPRNYAGYDNWNKCRSYLNSYEIEQEYLKYCEELSKQLKWMEDYLTLPPLQWGHVSTRGTLQALKIATSFSKITESLVYTAYRDCVDSMRIDFFSLKELDGIYFEIWQRVTQGTSFTHALREVYDLKRFPLRDLRMKYELENGSPGMEKEFRSCTAGISEVVTEDQARELIAARVKKLIEKPKVYEDYIRKKICIARAIGAIPTLVS